MSTRVCFPLFSPYVFCVLWKYVLCVYVFVQLSIFGLCVGLCGLCVGLCVNLYVYLWMEVHIYDHDVM